MSDIQKTILLVDDDAMYLEALAEILADNGYIIITANNGKVGIEAAETHSNIDLIITDGQMEPIDGFEMSKKIHEKYPQIPIILRSGRNYQNSFTNIGIRQCLIKTSPIPLLLKHIENLLS